MKRKHRKMRKKFLKNAEKVFKDIYLVMFATSLVSMTFGLKYLAYYLGNTGYIFGVLQISFIALMGIYLYWKESQ